MFNPSFRPSISPKDDDRSISFYHFLQLRPWVIVSNGSFQGYFDWVPETYRVGTWSFQAPFMLVGTFVYLLYSKPKNFREQSMHCDYALPGYWYYYNLGAAAWMMIVLVKNVREEGIVPYSTFTTWSWTLLMFRHILCAIVPLLSSESSSVTRNNMIWWSEALRCPSLLNAFVVFFVWNIILSPSIYFTQMKNEKEKAQFRKWLCTFNLLNQHGLNLPLAILSCIVSAPRKLTIQEDLWCGQVVLYLYWLFYVLVLDRIGVHLYPIFSPRSSACGIIWITVILIHYGLFKGMQAWVERSFEIHC